MSGELVSRVRAATSARASPDRTFWLTEAFCFLFSVLPVTSFASLLGDLRHGRHQLLRVRRRKHVSPTLWNLREAPADHPLPVE